MIAYSAEAEPARAYLLRAYNDLDIFVEDVACQNMYVRLFSRMLAKSGKRITHIFPLNSRKNVIDQCRKDLGTSVRRRLYVIDADQDLIVGRPAPRLRGLYRLKVYCSENLLLSEYATTTIGTEGLTSDKWHDVAASLALRSLLERATELLLPLFVAYGIAYKLNLGIETVRYPVHRLLLVPGDSSSLSKRLIRARILSITKQIRSQTSQHRYRRARNAVIAQLRLNTRDQADYLSAKTYLLPLVHMQLKQVARFRDSFEGLKVRLAQHCELNIDPGLARAILRAAK